MSWKWAVSFPTNHKLSNSVLCTLRESCGILLMAPKPYYLRMMKDRIAIATPLHRLIKVPQKTSSLTSINMRTKSSLVCCDFFLIWTKNYTNRIPLRESSIPIQFTKRGLYRVRSRANPYDFQGISRFRSYLPSMGFNYVRTVAKASQQFVGAQAGSLLWPSSLLSIRSKPKMELLPW